MTPTRVPTSRTSFAKDAPNKITAQYNATVTTKINFMLLNSIDITTKYLASRYTVKIEVSTSHAWMELVFIETVTQ